MEKGEQDDLLVFTDCFCPLCAGKRTSFSCEKCVRFGLFYDSRKRSEESYEEKRQRLATIKKLKANYAERVLQSTAIAKSTEQLKCDLQVCRNKVSVLRDAVSLLKKQEAADRSILTKTTDENKKRRSRLDKLKEGIKTQEKESSADNNEIQKKRTDLAGKLENISRIRRIRVDQIQKYLFPISTQKVFPEIGTPPDDTVVNVEGTNVVKLLKNNITHEICGYTTETETGNECDVGGCTRWAVLRKVSDAVVEGGESCEMALTEATRTSYIEGRWVNDDELGNIQYRILETFVPANGDYSAYSHWLKANKNGSSESVPTCNLRNSAFSLTAGLSYTCQLLDLMAFFLDITLPKDLSYSEFCLRELSGSEFKSAVSRLNANVMYLCLSQNVRAQMLHPKRTLQNIHACIQSSNVHLGRYGPHSVFDRLCAPSEDNEDDESSSEEESEVGAGLEFSSSDNEWETVLMDSQVPANLLDETVYSNSMQQRSTHDEQLPRQTKASSLVSSVTSLWPWKR